MKICLISLGCVKNQVDSEEILSYLARNSFELVSDKNLADIIVINTCGFLKASVEEAYYVIDDAQQYGKILVVVGCLAERYEEKLKRDKPFIDLIVPLHDYSNFGYYLQTLIKDRKLIGQIENTKKIYSTPSYQAYLKISDGCSNRCTYCAIPLIRGSFHSIPLETLKIEMNQMSNDGVRELVIISQDTTRYGTDHVELKQDICALLKMALKYEEFKFIRLLYLYPDEITDELICLFRDNPRLTPYFDIPIQHSSDKILKAMNRRGTREELVRLFKSIRSEVKNAVIRTTLIVGFPGETDEDFQDLVSFVEEVEFDHLGVFTYSREKGTPAYNLPNQVPSSIKASRYNAIMTMQQSIAYRKNKRHIGEIIDVIVTDYDERKYNYKGVCYILAPDDIDGNLYIYSNQALKYGEEVKCRIVNASVYDLEAEVVY